MDLSLRWLKDYVDLDIKPREYAHKMTMSGSKVEGYTIEGQDVTNVVVGKVLSIEAHPDADKLVVCQIDIGRAENIQIVTGATNVTVGALIPCALDNSVLPNGTKIKKGKLRGVLSQGMMCSLSELNLTIHDFPYAIEDGIFLIEEECEIGQNICDAIGLNDTCVEFEITSNRPDCLSVLGLARETATTYDVPLITHSPAVALKNDGDCITKHLTVDVQNTTLCPRYTAKMVKNVTVAPSPRWLRERLRASGIRPINNIVDITNYVMLEYCQPMHGFDYTNVDSGSIIVRNAQNGETMTTLDDIERTFTDEMLVITDSKKVIAVAGVMGGEYSGISDSTSVVIFESANFLGSSVRKTAKVLGLRTDSSARFEKGINADSTLDAVMRACELVELIGCGEVVDGIIDIDNSNKTPVTLRLEYDWINKFIGFNLSKENMINILTSLGFTVENDIITVPSFRIDIEHKADIAEEIARIYGYDNIPTSAITGVANGKVTNRQKFERTINDVMLSLGCNEVQTYSFISPKAYDKICLPAKSPLRNSVTISNPLGEDTSIMRTTTLPSMLEVLSRNYNNRNASMWGFEIGNEYIKNTDDTLPYENAQLTIGLYENGADFYLLKGMVETLLSRLNINDFDFIAVSDNCSFHPGQTAMVVKDDIVLGVIGQIHPTVASNYDINVKPFVAKLCVDSLYSAQSAEKQYKQLPKFPATTRDLSLVCPADMPVATISKTITDSAVKILESVTLFDIYQGEHIEAGKKSVAFKLTMRSLTGTLTEDEINSAVNKILKGLDKVGVILRG